MRSLVVKLIVPASIILAVSAFSDTVRYYVPYTFDNNWLTLKYNYNKAVLFRLLKRKYVLDDKKMAVHPNLFIKQYQYSNLIKNKGDKDLFTHVLKLNNALEFFKKRKHKLKRYNRKNVKTLFFSDEYTDRYNSDHECYYMVTNYQNKVVTFIIFDSTKYVFRIIEKEWKEIFSQIMKGRAVRFTDKQERSILIDEDISSLMITIFLATNHAYYKKNLHILRTILGKGDIYTYEFLVAMVEESNFKSYYAALTLKAFNDKKINAMLLNAFRKGDTSRKNGCAMAFGVMKIKEAVPLLIPCLTHEQKKLRNNSARALGDIGDSKALVHLIKAEKDKRNKGNPNFKYAIKKLSKKE